MKTTSYNPSEIEVEFATVIESLKDTISDKLSQKKILSVENHLNMDNPILKVYLIDDDGDKHTLVLKLIQKPDNTN